MYITVEGISIELTENQIALIKKEKAKRAKEYRGFAQTLRHFGFVSKSDTAIDGTKIKWFEHTKYNWFAEIRDFGNWKEVWLTGNYLKTSSFPGGWMYSEPKELADEIIKAIDFINNRKV